MPGTPTDVVFTLRNVGAQPLTLTGTPDRVTVSGSSDFTVAAQPAATVNAKSSTTFTVHFAPATTGLKTATLSIPSNDPDESPYVINLTGRGLSFTTDTDGDGMSDGEEILAGTDPASATSVFALGIESLPPGQHRVRVPTITGRHYTLQRRTAFGAGSWENVPGATDIAGDGTEKAFVQSSSGTNYFYHAIVNP